MWHKASRRVTPRKLRQFAFFANTEVQKNKGRAKTPRILSKNGKWVLRPLKDGKLHISVVESGRVQYIVVNVENLLEKWRGLKKLPKIQTSYQKSFPHYQQIKLWKTHRGWKNYNP